MSVQEGAISEVIFSFSQFKLAIDSARRIDIRIQFCKITTFWVICLNNLLQKIVIDKRKNTGTFIFGYAKDGAVRFSISLPGFAWFLMG